MDILTLALAKNGGSAGSAGSAIIDVVELPTENIREDVFYRVLTGTFLSDGSVMEDYTCVLVNSLPETGEPGVDTTTGIYTCYYSYADEGLYLYITEDLSAKTGLSVGWVDAATVGFTFGGFITTYEEAVGKAMYIYLSTEDVYQHKTEWTVVSGKGQTGDAVYSEVFNSSDNVASGVCSHAEGQRTTASGDYSHAEGGSTTASGVCSHAEGQRTTASGDYSHAEGGGATASGGYSHAEGRGTTARRNYAHAEGYNTTAAGEAQHAQGKYNIEDTANTYAHIVGNGTSSARSNAHTLDWSGNAWFAGTMEGTALILTSPNGTRYQITVDDTGALTAVAL